MTIHDSCDECGATIDAPDADALGDAWIAHVRAAHADWPYPDVAIRNYAEAALRLDGPVERVDALGDVEIHPVSQDRIDDWLAFFDRDAFADNRAWAACYCLEPHVRPKGAVPDEVDSRSWSSNREHMLELLRDGRAFGYLAYVDGRPAGWVNASLRSEYALYRDGPEADPPDAQVIGISCFVIAPPYRRHGLAGRLLERVVADAGERGVEWVEGYPFKAARADDDAGNFRGPQAMFEGCGFQASGEAERHVVVRRPA